MAKFDGEKMKSARREEGISRKILGNACGVSWRTVEGWEQNMRIPSNAALELLKLKYPKIYRKVFE